MRERVMHVLPERFMTTAEFRRTTYSVVTEGGTTVDEILRPEYWSHVARKLKPYDKIEVLAEEGTFYLELLVLRVLTGAVVVKLLNHAELESSPAAGDEDPDIEIKYSGPIKKYRVTRKSDGKVLAEGEEVATRQMAEQFVIEYRKALAA
jgi:hypothetical protein